MTKTTILKKGSILQMIEELKKIPGLEDVTGWQEQIEKHRISDVSFRVPKRIGIGSGESVPPVPYVIPMRLAELIIGDAKLNDAIRKKHEWNEILEATPDMGPEHPDWQRNPWDAHELIHRFSDWYAIQVDRPNKVGVWESCAIAIAFEVLSGRMESPASNEAISYIKNSSYAGYFGEGEV